MSPNPRRLPSYRLHKPSGLARVIINGEHVYLGKFGTAESWERYNRLIAERLRGANGVNPPEARQGLQSPSITVNELILAYWQFAQGYYR